MASCVALVVAAGRGTRLGGPLPKQYLPLGGVAVLRHAVRALAQHPAVDAVRVIIHPDDRGHYDAATGGLDLLEPVAGGAQRQDSVRNGLESLVAIAPDLVLVHDGARPFLDAPVIDRVLAGMGVALVEGSEDNFKVTTTDDLARAERLLAARCGDIRTGQGFDVHAFGPGDGIWLCGIAVPHSHGLVGHSDADVGLHALTD